MRIYLSAAYPRRDEVRGHVRVFMARGHEVVASWLNETAPLDVQVPSLPEGEAGEIAARDLAELAGADAMVAWGEGPDSPHKRGGRLVELGYALARGLPVIVIGPCVETVFHTPRHVHYAPDVEGAIGLLAFFGARQDKERCVACPGLSCRGPAWPGMGCSRTAAERRIVDAETGGEKGAKLARYDLIPPVALDAVAEVYGRGCEKYAARNWEKGYSWGLSFAALMRHAWAFWRGEETDEDSGLPHLAHAAWHCLTLMEFARWHRAGDDRGRE